MGTLESLTPLTLLHIRLVLRAEDSLLLPAYKGATLRGGFGVAFKDAVCVVEHRTCERCLLRSQCAYPYVFETPVPEGTTRMRKYPAAPHPFVFLPPLEEKTRYRAGETLTFDMTLIGKGAAYLPYFIYAFERLGRHRGFGKGRGRFSVAAVLWRTPQGEAVPIYTETSRTLSAAFRPVTIRDLLPDVPSTDVWALRFVTPTRLVYCEAPVSKPDFHVIVRGLLRRLSNLTYFHCGTDLRLDFRMLIAAAESVETVESAVRWYDWERYSTRQDRRMKMGGFIGRMQYRGDLRPFLPFLRLGEVLHIGKHSSFGMGHYVMESGS